MKAVEQGGTAIGIRCKDGIVLALEKLVTSKLLKKDANKRIATVDRNVGVVRYIRILAGTISGADEKDTLLTPLVRFTPASYPTDATL